MRTSTIGSGDQCDNLLLDAALHPHRVDLQDGALTVVVTSPWLPALNPNAGNQIIIIIIMGTSLSPEFQV